MKTKILYGIASFAVVIFSVLFTVKLIQSKPKPRTREQIEDLLNVKAEEVINKDYSSSIKYRGRVSSYENISLSAEVGGRILQGDIPFKAGQSFRKNDLLIQIYNEDIKAALMSGKSNFLRTISSILPDVNVDFPNEFDKWKTFFTSIKVDESLPELPKTKTEQEQIYLASKGVLADYYSLRQKEINLKKYTIYAPFDGSFKTVAREIGSVANMGGELASIIRTDRLEVIVPVLPEDAKWIKVGNKANLIGSNNIESGVVARISDFIDASTQSINIYITYMPKNNKKFFTGEYIDVEFSILKNVSGIKIPREALLNNNQVYLIQNKSLAFKNVNIERTLDDHYIISGVDNGEIIVTESLADVSEGTKVAIRN
ncbi:MAG: HlyD family efflux transporter periplasmic adaptor subunit [Bacteroidales bacterium]|nr:HlyD family efflux transporter periplasmic adaptor subunit [Bacteroidales bacterium]